MDYGFLLSVLGGVLVYHVILKPTMCWICKQENKDK